MHGPQRHRHIAFHTYSARSSCITTHLTGARGLHRPTPPSPPHPPACVPLHRRTRWPTPTARTSRLGTPTRPSRASCSGAFGEPGPCPSPPLFPCSNSMHTHRMASAPPRQATTIAPCMPPKPRGWGSPALPCKAPMSSCWWPQPASSQHLAALAGRGLAACLPACRLVAEGIDRSLAGMACMLK